VIRRQRGGRASDEGEMTMFGWFKRSRPERTATDPLAEALNIISAYGELLTKYPSAIMDASLLPASKKAMVEAFKIAWRGTHSSEARNWIEIGWAFLPNFQDGVGDVPITAEIPNDNPTEATIARLREYSLWAKLADAEGAIMQRDRDEFKKANST
jgi:hypothetical protein